MEPLYPWFKHELEALSSLFIKQSLPHALLLTSAGGLGTANMVQHLSRLILCQQPAISTEQGGCGQCKSCLLFAAGSHPDIYPITFEEGKKQLRVDQIRRASQFIQGTAQQGRNKVVTIEPADQMNLQAANALLKSLEEPPEGTFLILITDRPMSLLPTVRSRCFKMAIKPPTSDMQRDWLNQKIQDTNILEMLMSVCEGQPCKAMELYEGDGLEVRNKLHEDLEAMLSGKLSSVEIAAKWNKLPISQVMYWLSFWMTDACRFVGSKGQTLLRDPLTGKVVKYTIKNANADSIFTLTDYILETKAKFDNQANLNQQLVLEDILIRWLTAIT